MIFGVSKKERISKGLLEINEHPDLLKSFTALQNEIGVGFDMKTLAVTSVHSDLLAASFAKAFADTFANNGSSALIIVPSVPGLPRKNSGKLVTANRVLPFLLKSRGEYIMS